MIRRFTIAALVAVVACILWASQQSVAEQIPSAAASAAEQPESPEAKEAAELFKKGDHDGALKLLKELVKKDPNLPPAQVIMARWFLQTNVPGGMRVMLEQAVTASPDDPEVYVMMGGLAIAEGRVTEAKLLFEKADSLAANWNGNAKRKQALLPQIQAGLAQACEAHEQWAEAQKHIENWVKLDPKSADALQRFARCLFQQKNIPGTLEKLKEASKVDPQLLTPEAILARWFAQSGKPKDAETWIIAALNIAPKDARTRVVAAQWAFENGRLEDAKKQAEAARRLDPKSFDAKIISGLVAYFQKDYRTAETYFQSALNDAPNELKFAASNNLALALIEQNDEPKKAYAYDLASKNASKYQRRADALSTYGWVLYRRGQLDDAEKVLVAVARSGSMTADAAYYFACVLKDRGQDVAARRWLEGALRTAAPFQHREEAKALLQKLPEAKPEAK